jgi:integrase
LAGDVVALVSTFRAEHGAALGFEHIRLGFLPVDENGAPLRPKRWSDMWRTHCQTAGVPVLTLHSARHSSVTALRAAGVRDDVGAVWHGHDETIMRAVYSHPDAVAMASAGRTLSDVLGR